MGSITSWRATGAGLAFALAACGSDPGHGHNEAEVITTIQLTFAPAGGGAPVVAVADDPDGDGGEPPTVDPIELAVGSYDLAVRFENRLEDPAEDITVEVEDEADQHMVFFTGTAVDGPASDRPGAPLAHLYGDQDENGLPIGLANDVVAAAGAGVLTVTLRHLPPINATAVKTEDTAAEVASGGLTAIGGETDATASFELTVE